jgi:hypothetical protein
MFLLLLFLLSHLLGDFFLQPSAWVQHKEARKWASPYLYLHVLLHFLLLLLLTRAANRDVSLGSHFSEYLVPALVITVLHLLIDGLKLSRQQPATRRRWFLIDQGLHLLVLVLVWSWLKETPERFGWLVTPRFLSTATTTLFLLKPTSLLIKMVISRWSPEGPSSQPSESAVSLQHAGALIGYLERLLVLVFILTDHWEGVGFLLAAKSIFRFGDLKEAQDRQLTEYVLIGTLLSFGMAVLTALALQAAWR